MQHSITSDSAVGIRQGRFPALDPIDAFFKNIHQCSHGEGCSQCCWEWHGGRTALGYGQSTRQMKNGKVEYAAYRIVWILYNQRYVPDNMEIAHTCDNPPCCNPAHLWLCTHQENMHDMILKGRGRGALTTRKGEEVASAKLTEKHIHHIWWLRIIKRHTHKAIAQEMGVTRDNISQILRRRTWKHIPIPDFKDTE